MDEHEFERGLERMFAQPPAFRDSELFARAVESRLNRNWRMRAIGIGVAGAVGGVIAISQTIGSGFGLEMREASVDATASMDRAYAGLAEAVVSLGGAELAGMDLGANVFWMVAAAFVLVAGAIATRIFDEA